MKFSHQLKFNSVPEWRAYYLDYAHLKKFIFAIARAEQEDIQMLHEATDTQNVQQPLLHHAVTLPHGHDRVEATEENLRKALDKELQRIISFYMTKEAEMLAKFTAMEVEIHSLEKLPRSASLERTPSPQGAPGTATSPQPGASTQNSVEPGFRVSFNGAGSQSFSTAPPSFNSAGAPPVLEHAATFTEGGVCTQVSRARAVRVQFWNSVSPARWASGGGLALGTAAVRELQGHKERLRQTFGDLFLHLNDLHNFLMVNKEGFRKIIKKHDKMTSSNLKESYWPFFEAKYPIQRSELLQKTIESLVDHYAVIYLGGNTNLAKDSLDKVLRDQIKVERNTVWRDMVAQERRTMAAVVEGVPKRAPFWATFSPHFALLGSILVFVILLNVEIFEDEPEKQNCLALLVFVSSLWATEAVPLYVTSLMIPLLAVTLRVLVDHTVDPPVRMMPQAAAPAIFHSMCSQVILLLLGGSAIASALTKHFIAKKLAQVVLARAGRKPHNVLLALMLVAAVASMFISNVAAPVLCWSLVDPILKSFDATSPFSKSLVMGIALASNIGGMTSPISSPQNIFAIERMSMDGHPPSWLSWFAVALPVAFICILVCWGLILGVYRPWTKVAEVRPLKPSSDKVTFTQIYVVLVTLATVGLWCCNTLLQPYTGEMGIVATLPIIAFFGFGVLNKDDFLSSPWLVMTLAMGGLALGEAVKSSGLLVSIAHSIGEVVQGFDLFTVLVIFCSLVLVCTSFISHTVGAMIILPIVQSVGEQMPGHPHAKLLVMGAALMTSGAMGLPVSGFPNMFLISKDDGTGKNYINTLDFIKVGVPGSVGAFFVIITVGYMLMLMVRF